jgi:hypothetical protein
MLIYIFRYNFEKGLLPQSWEVFTEVKLSKFMQTADNLYCSNIRNQTVSFINHTHTYVEFCKVYYISANHFGPFIWYFCMIFNSFYDVLKDRVYRLARTTHNQTIPSSVIQFKSISSLRSFSRQILIIFVAFY